MNTLRRWIYFCATLTFTSYLHADTIDHADGLQDRDIQALREWVNTKRQVTVKEKGGALSISGEVRSEFQHTVENSNGETLRGTRALPTNAFDVEFNLLMDYRADNTWASVKVEFDNNAGTFSGTLDRLKLERAYFGVRIINEDTYSFDVEIGRHNRINSFVDTKLEGDSFFDGIFVRYDQGFENIGDFYTHVGTFLVDERREHYAYLGEIGFLNIANTGLYTKYLLIDWDTKNLHNRLDNDRFRFLVSQLLFGYKFVPKKLDKVVILYVAGLWNHEARKLAITDHKRANFGGYIGFSIGELQRKYDWSFEAYYEVLAAQAVPDFDTSGVGIGNAPRAGFYTVRVDGSGGPTTRKTAAGNGNLRGYSLTLEYLLTSNLVLFQSWNQSITLDDHIGPFRRFHQYEMEFLYSF